MDGPGPWARDEQGELPRLLREASPGLRAGGLDSAPASGRRVGVARPGKELSTADERARGRPVLLRGSSPASLFPLVTGLDSVSVQVAVSTHLPSRACADRRTRACTHGFSHQGVAHLRATGTPHSFRKPPPQRGRLGWGRQQVFSSRFDLIIPITLGNSWGSSRFPPLPAGEGPLIF